MKKKIKLVTASAGSGKTHKLKTTLADFLNPANPYKIRPEGVIATTFTKKAALELRERARSGLISEGFFDEAIRLEGALVSTVHAVCTKLIEKFAYECGLPPKLEVLPEDDQSIYFNSALSSVLTPEITYKMESLTRKITCPDHKGKTEDWRKTVKSIMDEARSNSIDHEGIDRSLKYSWEKIKSILGEPLEATAFEAEVLSEGRRIREELEALPKRGQNDEKLLDCLKEFLRSLEEKSPYISWDKWLSLSQSKLNKPGESLALGYLGRVGDFIRHPDFQEDYYNYLETIFNTASQALDAYQKYKRERGLVDFTDMECMVLGLLEQETVQKRILQEYDLLLVDEFQDTSPIQLAIFLKLSQLIPNAIWVGDQKQSIYGFRGADPALMDALLQKMKSELDIETLGNSYRSRPDLVKHANALFLETFKGIMPPEQIKLEAQREEKAEFLDAVEVWRIEKSGKYASNVKTMRGIAAQIESIITEKRQVAKKQGDDKEILRDIEPKDIAVLCSSNENTVSMARCLKELNLSVNHEEEGLLSLPESKLFMAALRYYAHPDDSLSIIEMKLLVDGKDNVEELIDERLLVVSEEKINEYGKDHAFIQKIDALRPLAMNLSPVETINHFLIDLELERVVGSWGEGPERWENLIRFREYAQKYEEYSERLKTGATLGGFLLWLEDRDASGLLHQGGSGENAITVMTWHRSKGLEWPLVVLNDCGREVRKLPFGVKVISTEVEIDLDNPLKGRLIRFWFNPFHRSRKNYPFLESLLQTAEAQYHAAEAVKEAGRLLYVGITRARDYLCLPLKSKEPAKFISEVLGSDQKDLPKGEGEHLLSWASDCKAVLVKNFFDVENPPARVEAGSKVLVRKNAKGRGEFGTYCINPSAQLEIVGAKAKHLGTYGKRLTVKTKIDDAILGDCLHDIAAISDLTLNDVERILTNYNLENVLIAEEVLVQIHAFYKYMTDNGFQDPSREIPFLGKLDGQVVTGVIDLLMKSNEEYVLIDHKSYQGTKLEEKAISFSGQLALYGKMLNTEKSGSKKSYINFLTLGQVWEVDS